MPGWRLQRCAGIVSSLLKYHVLLLTRNGLSQSRRHTRMNVWITTPIPPNYWEPSLGQSTTGFLTRARSLSQGVAVWEPKPKLRFLSRERRNTFRALVFIELPAAKHLEREDLLSSQREPWHHAQDSVGRREAVSLCSHWMGASCRTAPAYARSMPGGEGMQSSLTDQHPRIHSHAVTTNPYVSTLSWSEIHTESGR